MEFNDILKSRRSVRNFRKADSLDKETILELVKAANESPSWRNKQASRYHCVYTKEMVEKFRANCLPEYNINNTENAVAYVVCTFVSNRCGFTPEGVQTNELGNGWGIYDSGISNTHFMLAAMNKGIDTLILGLRYIDVIKEMLEIPDNEIIVSVIALGYRAEEPTKAVRKPLEKISKFY